MSKKNKPELTYSDYISLGELRNALDKRLLINKLTSPIIMTRDRNFTPVKPPGKQGNIIVHAAEIWKPIYLVALRKLQPFL